MAMTPLVYLVGANLHYRSSICQTGTGDFLQVESVASVAELRPQVLPTVAAILAWDQGGAIPQLRAHLSILGHRTPIIAIAERPSVRQIVRALTSGAVDYLPWPCSSEVIVNAVTSAVESTERSLPSRQRSVEARRLLERLSRREREVLSAMSQGMPNQTIAELLAIDPGMVEIHRRDLLAKLGAEHSADAIRVELEAAHMPESNKQSAWVEPWLFDGARAARG